MRKRIQRFYTRAEAAARSEGGFRILLDGRLVETPAGAELALPNRALAEAVAGEWAAQGEDVDPAAMALSALAATAIDVVGRERPRVAAELAAYGGHDLVCYRAEAPEDLVARQHATWQPLLDWAALTLDAPLTVTAGLVPVTQPEAAVAALRRAVETLDDLELAALGAAVTAAGSLVIGLALNAGRIDAETAFEAAQLDETYQIEQWGEDPEAARRRAAIRADLEAAARFLALHRG